MDILRLILHSVFAGYAMFSVVYLVISKLGKPGSQLFMNQYEPSASLLFRVIGVAYAFLIIITVLQAYSIDENYLTNTSTFEWIQIFTYVILPFLFWIPKLRRTDFLRLLLIFIVIILPIFDVLYQVFVASHREYAPINYNWWYYLKSLLVPISIPQLLTFLGLLWLVHFFRRAYYAKP